MNRLMKNLAIYMLLVLLVVAALYGFQPAEQAVDPFDGNYNAFITALEQEKIGSLSIALKIPNWVYGSFVPIGLAFILYRSIQFIVQLQKKSEEDEN